MWANIWNTQFYYVSEWRIIPLTNSAEKLRWNVQKPNMDKLQKTALSVLSRRLPDEKRSRAAMLLIYRFSDMTLRFIIRGVLLEAGSIELTMNRRIASFRCNLVTLFFNEKLWGQNHPWLLRRWHFIRRRKTLLIISEHILITTNLRYSGVSYRHYSIWKQNGTIDIGALYPPHWWYNG